MENFDLKTWGDHHRGVCHRCKKTLERGDVFPRSWGNRVVSLCGKCANEYDKKAQEVYEKQWHDCISRVKSRNGRD